MNAGLWTNDNINGSFRKNYLNIGENLMLRTDESRVINSDLEMNIKDQVLKDLEKLAFDKKMSVRELIKEMANTSDISLRNLERIVGKSDTSPSNETLIKIYSYMYSTNSLIDLILKVPEIIADSLKSEYLIFNKSTILTKTNKEIINLTKDHVFNTIYFMTSGDYGTDLETIREEFGKLGLNIVDKLMLIGIVKIDSNDRLVRNNSILPTAEIRINLINTLAKLYNPSKNETVGKNYSGIFMGDVTVEDFDAIYLYIRECFDHIGKKISDSKPTQENCRKLAIGGLMEELEKNKSGGILC